MKIFVEASYDAMSERAFHDMMAELEGNPAALICPASGDSPAGLYKLLVKTKPNTADWHFIGLDEWVGMNGNDEGSCRWHLNKDLFNPLGVENERICFFDGRAEHLTEECLAIERFIERKGGIDLAVVGLGMNGHVGMNEPGVDPLLHSHIVELHAQTRASAQKYFTSFTQLEKGISLGIANLMEAKSVLLLVSGKSKAAIVKQVLEEEISASAPASLLKSHAGLRVYLDREAASLLQKNVYAE
jgi:galactosamine-6-phosphate isomerase